MGEKVIPKEIQQEVSGIIDEFNKKHFHGRTNSVAYFADLPFSNGPGSNMTLMSGSFPAPIYSTVRSKEP